MPISSKKSERLSGVVSSSSLSAAGSGSWILGAVLKMERLAEAGVSGGRMVALRVLLLGFEVLGRGFDGSGCCCCALPSICWPPDVVTP